MPRPPRIDIQDGWHHVMNRGVDHGIVLFEDTDRVGRDGALFGGRFHPRLISDGALIEAVELVLAERGLSADRRPGAVARQLALAWLAEQGRMPDDVLMATFGIDRLGTLRTAISRARAVLRSEPGLVDAQQRAVGLVLGGRLHRGSDP